MRPIHLEGAYGRLRVDITGEIQSSGACHFAPGKLADFCIENALHNGVLMVGDNERYAFAVTEMTNDGFNYFWLMVDNVFAPDQVALEPRTLNEVPAWSYCPAAEVMAGYFRRLDESMNKEGVKWPEDDEKRICVMGDVMLSDEPWPALLVHQFPLLEGLPDLCFRHADGSVLYITPNGLPTTRYPVERLAGRLVSLPRDYKLAENSHVAGSA
jgi:hypothetical protein